MNEQTPHRPIHHGAGVRPVEAFAETYGLVFRNLGVLGRLLLVPLGVAAAGSYWAYERQLASIQRMAETGVQPGFEPAQLVPIVVQILVFTAFATAWHRWILVGPGALPAGLGLSWNRTEWIYLAALVALYVASFLLMALGVAVTQILFFAAQSLPLVVVTLALTVAVSVYFFCRACLVLPAAAVVEQGILRNTLRRSKAKVFRIFLAFLLVFLPIVLADIALYLALVPSNFAALEETPAALYTTLARLRLPSLISGLVLYGLTAALFVALLSVLYRQLTGFGHGEGEAPAARPD